jgi:hypothetical protein
LPYPEEWEDFDAIWHHCLRWGSLEESKSKITSYLETLSQKMQTLHQVKQVIEYEGEDANELWIFGENLNSKIEWEIIKIIHEIEKEFNTIFELRVIDLNLRDKINVQIDGVVVFEK